MSWRTATAKNHIGQLDWTSMVRESPHRSKSTRCHNPCKTCSSQTFRGVSLNNLLMKGPDVLNQICAVLLRFRDGVHAAL